MLQSGPLDDLSRSLFSLGVLPLIPGPIPSPQSSSQLSLSRARLQARLASQWHFACIKLVGRISMRNCTTYNQSTTTISSLVHHIRIVPLIHNSNYPYLVYLHISVSLAMSWRGISCSYLNYLHNIVSQSTCKISNIQITSSYHIVEAIVVALSESYRSAINVRSRSVDLTPLGAA